jgi:hypothetical protein
MKGSNYMNIVFGVIVFMAVLLPTALFAQDKLASKDVNSEAAFEVADAVNLASAAKNCLLEKSREMTGIDDAVVVEFLDSAQGRDLEDICPNVDVEAYVEDPVGKKWGFPSTRGEFGRRIAISLYYQQEDRSSTGVLHVSK